MESRIGIFICNCKGLVSDPIDTARVAEEAARLEGVAFVDCMDMLCKGDDFGAAVRKLKESGCDRMLFAGCSPRSSLKFPEERIAAVMSGTGLSPELFEVANIREQCAWQHSDREKATDKACDLVRMAHARLETDTPAHPPVEIPQRALVVGAGPAGLQTAKDLAAAGIDVTLTEKKPWMGGHLCQLHRIYQSDGWPSFCDSSCVGPVQAKGAMLDNRIEVMTNTEVTASERLDGSFKVTMHKEAEFVDPDLCISCDECAKVCPEETKRPFDQGLTTRKAIDKEFERAVPDLYTLDTEACTMCGDCVPVCPTNAINLEAKPSTITKEFGAVFIATGFTQPDTAEFPDYNGTHPNVVTSLEFERIMDHGLKRPSDKEKPETVVFVQCAGSRAGPEKQSGGVAYCSKTCCSITAKQVDRMTFADPMIEPIVVYYRDMRTYERALEALYQKLRISGVEFINGEVAEITGNGDGQLTLSIDPILREDEEEGDPITQQADLVVLAGAQKPSEGTDELYRMFGVKTDRYGFPVENQPRLFRPTESLVNRVFVIGASAGPKDVQHASEQGSAAAMRALPDLAKGKTEPLKFASRVNPDRCTGCRTCEGVCPHGAIRQTEEGAVIDPAFCQACGFCAAACPVHAAELNNFTDEQILAQARVAFETVPEGEPRILALLCYWCSYSAADFAGVARVEAPPNHRVIRIRCSSSVNTGLIMKMFTLGVDGILVAGCPERSCHHLWGNFVADKRTDLAKAFMNQLGLNADRLRFEYIGAPMQKKLMATLNSMDASLRKLGPNPAQLCRNR